MVDVVETREGEPDTAARKTRLGVLARASSAELEAVLAMLPAVPPHRVLRGPEIGAIMLRGRAGGTGRRFNLGEATVTRCAIRLEDGTSGVAYALGRDLARAKAAALLDALSTREDAAAALVRLEVGRLGGAQAAARDLASRKAAATKVEFFTMVRGE
jgi:alpha-D-ribose 1-methylphosphonate 5-triphosphate synthase subunit PhnG